MLTPTDTHLLAGILTQLTTPENVEIVLGHMLLDEAAERKRDIDITVNYKDDDGQDISLVGLHVKDHDRPLGSPEVEQLCTHIKDTPTIKKGGIISASGYSKPAIKKAKYHGIDLYELKEWDFNSNQLNHLQFSENFEFHEQIPRVIGSPIVNFILDKQVNEGKLKMLTESTQVLDNSGKMISNVNNISDLIRNAINIVMNSDKTKKDLEENINKEIIIKQPVEYSDKPTVKLKNELVQVLGVNLEFRAMLETKKSQVKFKILSKLDDPQFDAGTAVFELSNGNLMGLSTSNMDKSVKLINIPMSDRLKNKIREIRLK